MNFQETLQNLRDKGLLRSLSSLPSCGGKFTYKGKCFLNFSCNDYLNLASDKRIKNASKKAIEKWGCGATASRLMSGHLTLHEKLEQELATFFRQESALVFGSGFLANLGAISALVTPVDFLFFDRLVHASLIDGIRLSNAKWKSFKHKDTEELERLLQKYSREKGQKFIVTESVFSMDGDIAPLKKINFLAKKYGAFLIVDEAHAIGIFESGICKQTNTKPDVITGTLSKSIGNHGGFVACSSTIRNWLINRARSFIYTTALFPASIAGSLQALQIIQKEKNLGKLLLQKARYFHDLLNQRSFSLSPFESHIIPVIIGENKKAIQLAEALWQEGLYVKAIRTPTVPPGTARLRFSITLAHSEDDLSSAAEKIAHTAKSLSLC